MKTLYLKLGLILIASMLLTKCSCTNNNDGDLELETDNTAPEITIISPGEDEIFYTVGGIDSPDFLVLQASATDDNKIVRAEILVSNSGGEIVDSTLNIPVIANAIYATFNSYQEGNYKVEFKFVDKEGNVGSKSVNIICNFSPLDQDTDAAKPGK